MTVPEHCSSGFLADAHNTSVYRICYDHYASIAEDATKTLAFDKIANPFIGIIAGIIGSMCYNKFKDTKLPDWLSFFSGKRCVAIVAGVVSILASVVLLFVWPLLFGGLVALGEAL